MFNNRFKRWYILGYEFCYLLLNIILVVMKKTKLITSLCSLTTLGIIVPIYSTSCSNNEEEKKKDVLVLNNLTAGSNTLLENTDTIVYTIPHVPTNGTFTLKSSQPLTKIDDDIIATVTLGNNADIDPKIKGVLGSDNQTFTFTVDNDHKTIDETTSMTIKVIGSVESVQDYTSAKIIIEKENYEICGASSGAAFTCWQDNIWILNAWKYNQNSGTLSFSMENERIVPFYWKFFVGDNKSKTELISDGGSGIIGENMFHGLTYTSNKVSVNSSYTGGIQAGEDLQLTVKAYNDIDDVIGSSSFTIQIGCGVTINAVRPDGATTKDEWIQKTPPETSVWKISSDDVVEVSLDLSSYVNLYPFYGFSSTCWTVSDTSGGTSKGFSGGPQVESNNFTGRFYVRPNSLTHLFEFEAGTYYVQVRGVQTGIANDTSPIIGELPIYMYLVK